jgi:hypothetical protein
MENSTQTPEVGYLIKFLICTTDKKEKNVCDSGFFGCEISISLI